MFAITVPCSVLLKYLEYERSCFDGNQESFYQESTCTIAISPIIARGTKSQRGECGFLFLLPAVDRNYSRKFPACYGSSVSGAARVVPLWFWWCSSFFCEDDLSLALFVFWLVLNSVRCVRNSVDLVSVGGSCTCQSYTRNPYCVPQQRWLSAYPVLRLSPMTVYHGHSCIVSS